MLPALALFVQLTGAAAAAVRPPASDVLLISIDDLRADRVRPDLMPNLSKLALESLRFASVYSETTWTLPSHASLLASMYPGSHGAGGLDGSQARGMLPGIPNLAQVLGRAGYSAASYTNCPFFRPIFGLVEGFLPRQVIPLLDDPTPDAEQWFLRMAAPRFLFLHTYAVHNYLNTADPPRDPSGAWRCPIQGLEWNAVSKTRSCTEIAEAYDRAAYCADMSLGKMFDDLKAAGRWDKTLVVVVSDHGESLCEGAKEPRMGHVGPPFDEQVHVPLLVKLPDGRFAGRREDSPAQLLDVAPTILDALRLPLERGFQGRSLLPDSSAGAAARRDFPAFFDMDKGLGVRFGGWKLFRMAWMPPSLFNLRSDPGETRDLARLEPRRLAALQAVLRDHFGRQSAGWRIASRGAAGSRFTLTVRSNERLALFMTAFTGPDDRLVVSADSTTARAEFTSTGEKDEKWLIVEASTPTATLTLEALVDGHTPAKGRVFFGGAALEAPGPWSLSAPDVSRRGTVVSPPASADGISFWRAGSERAAQSMPPYDSDVREELRAAGYLR